MEKLDKNLIRQRFGRHLSTYDSAAEIQRQMAEKLLELFKISTDRRDFARILEFGCGSGILTSQIEQTFNYSRLFLNDFVNECRVFHRNRESTEFILGDIEEIALPETLDLILSNAVIQWVTDLPSLLKKLHKALSPGGWLALTTFGPQNLYEITALTGRGLRYLPPETLKQLLSSEFELINFQQELIKLYFDTPWAVLKHLKSTGVTATGAPAPWSRKQLEEFTVNYRRFQLPDGRYPLTYNPFMIIVKKRV